MSNSRLPAGVTTESILRAYALCNNVEQVARQLGIGSTTVKLRVSTSKDKIAAIRQQLDADGLRLPPAPAVTADPIEETQRVIERSRLLSQERELLLDVAGERSLRAELVRLVQETAKVFDPPPRYAPVRARPAAVQETALLHLSDWHAYEVVKKQRVQGLNEYNATVFARRVKRVVDQVIARKQRMEGGGVWRIPNLVVACNGDFVSGTIHETERHMDAPNVVMSVYGCGMTLAASLRDLAAQFEQVTVVCTSGNHGRLPDQRKMHGKDPTRNWDTLIYLLAESSLQLCQNVRFFIPDSYVASFSIGTKRFVQYHGHMIKSWAQIPHYGIGRWTRNNQAMRSVTNDPVDYYLMGHFHSDSSLPSPRGKTYINGSIIGGTEFGIETLGVCELPMQRLFLVSDPIGITDEVPIYGEVPGEPYGATYPAYPWERIA